MRTERTTHFDVFNGDADGICALQQLRLLQPRPAQLVTGLKREIALLERVRARAGDSVTVLDVSLDRNRAALQALLARGVELEYFDHHHPGELPVHPGLRLFIDTDPATCTSLIVHRHLGGALPAWAVAGAFGDNLPASAQALARDAGLPEAALPSLQALGEAINYNAYGAGEADVLVHPQALYRALRPYADPLAFLDQAPIARALVARRREDLERSAQATVHDCPPAGTVYLLPDEPWARRVQGAFANQRSLQAPARAHAVLRASGADAFMVNVRAPRTRPTGADRLCLAFGGGGRAAAAGIDRLPRDRLPGFMAAFARAFPQAEGAGPSP